MLLFTKNNINTGDKNSFYHKLNLYLTGLISDEPDWLANLANAAALLYLEMDDFKDLVEYEDHVVLILSTKFSNLEGIGTSLFTVVIPYLKKIRMSFINKEVNINIKKAENWVDILLKICGIVHNLYEETLKVQKINEN